MFGNLDFSCQGCFDIWIMNNNTNHRADHIKNKDIHPTALWRPFHICFAAHGYVRLLTVPWIFYRQQRRVAVTEDCVSFTESLKLKLQQKMTKQVESTEVLHSLW